MELIRNNFFWIANIYEPSVCHNIEKLFILFSRAHMLLEQVYVSLLGHMQGLIQKPVKSCARVLTLKAPWIRLSVSSCTNPPSNALLFILIFIPFPWPASGLQFNPKYLVKKCFLQIKKKKKKSHGVCPPSQYFQTTSSWDRNLEQGVSTTQFRRKSNDKKNNPRLHNNKGLNLNVSL